MVLLHSLSTTALGEPTEKVRVGISLALTGTGAAMSLDDKDGLLFANQVFYQNLYEFIFKDDR